MPYKDWTVQREYQKEWKRKRRQQYLGGKVCVWCGAAENLQIHHVDPAEKDTHRIWSLSTKRIEAELEKCIILCQDCHWECHRSMEEVAGVTVTRSVNSGFYTAWKPGD